MHRPAALLALCALGSSPALAYQGIPVASPINRSSVNNQINRFENKFLVRVGIGLGWGHWFSEDSDTHSTFGVDLNAIVGLAVIPELALHVGFSGGYMPSIYSLSAFGQTLDVSLSHIFVGLGATYYTLGDFYFTGQVGWGQITLDASTNTIDLLNESSEGSIGFNLGFGKEWWIVDDITLGVGLNALWLNPIEDSSYLVLGLNFLIGINP